MVVQPQLDSWKQPLYLQKQMKIQTIDTSAPLVVVATVGAIVAA
jgi:hypothetical protein